MTAKLNKFFLPKIFNDAPQTKPQATAVINSQQLFSLQYLRGFAALLVVWQHAVFKMPNFLPSASLHTGAIGVAVFFVISGFVMQMTTDGKNISPFEFLKRRVIRVAPLYWLMTILFSVLLLVRDPSVLMNDVSPMRMIKSLLFIPHISPIQHGHIWPILIPGWTLNYEMFFYVVFAISMFFKSRIIILSTFFLSLVLLGDFYKPFNNPLLVTYTHPLFLEFLFGMIIYQLWKLKSISLPVPISLLLICIGLVLLFEQGATDYFDESRLLGAAILVFGSLNARFLALKSKTLLAIGNASYSIYLSHILTVPMVFGLLKNTLHLGDQTLISFVSFMVCAMIASSVVGYLVYLKIELPMLNWMKHRFLLKRASYE